MIFHYTGIMSPLAPINSLVHSQCKTEQCLDFIFFQNEDVEVESEVKRM